MALAVLAALACAFRNPTGIMTGAWDRLMGGLINFPL